MTMFFAQIYIYDNNNKNIYILIHEKNLKKYLRFFNKTFSNCQATYIIRSNVISCLKNQAIFHRVNIEIGLTPPLPLFVFICLLRTALHNKPFIKKGLLEEMEGVNDNASAFMHLNIKTNK